MRGAQVARTKKSMTESLTRKHFLPHVNKKFHVRGGGHAFTLARIEGPAADAPAQSGGMREPFNLIFSGPPKDVLREGLYIVDVEDGPHFELYLIPIHTPARDRQDYQAAFN
jgi:hypothetical protein